MNGFISTAVEARAFLADYRPCPAHLHGTMAGELWGDARFHWHWWYRRKRLARRKIFEPLIAGEIGRIDGVEFVTA